MGCAQSNSAAQSKPLHQHAGDLNGTGKEVAPPPLQLPSTLTTFLPADGPLSPDEFRARLLSTDGTQEVPMPRAKLVLRYAFVSFRGLYPEAPGKANQDAVCAYRRFANDAEQAFFGVFDGHGIQGTACAQFAKEKVRPQLTTEGVRPREVAGQACMTGCLRPELYRVRGVCQHRPKARQARAQAVCVGGRCQPTWCWTRRLRRRPRRRLWRRCWPPTTSCTTARWTTR